ncbi:MAG: phosphoribosylamine--glycine ligase [Myxococcota bacterium]
MSETTPEQSFLVIGSGGREHAIAWKLSTSPSRPTVYVIPGNDGIARDEAIRCVRPSLEVTDHSALARFAREQNISLTVVGPEAPLSAGIVDHFEAAGLPIFGPKQAAAQLEASKAFAKEIMVAAGVPTAAYAVFDALEPALAYARGAAHPLVIKADGLAAGKGVVISPDVETSVRTLKEFIADARFGDASARVVLEEFLEGVECSFMVLTDGDTVLPLSTSQDHKRLGDGDVGPNTGGMGALVPSPHASDELVRVALEQVVRPTLAELRARGIEYAGFLYAGLMLTDEGPKVLEFNVRLGDPETQALMAATHADLADILLRASTGDLHASEDLAEGAHACCVVLASRGYPGERDTGFPIEGLDAAASHAHVKVFHAGTKAMADGRLVNSGGRVLGVTATGADQAEARARAYAAVAEIRWEGMTFRGDIG